MSILGVILTIQTLFILVSAFFAIILNSCAGSKVEVNLSDLNPKLKSFENDSTYDVVSGVTQYKTYGKPKYDNVFKEATYTRATISQLRFTLEHLVGDSTRFPSNAKSAKFGVAMIKMAQKQVPLLPKRVKTILDNASQLNPAEDFTSLDATAVPSVGKSIQKVMSDMTESSSDLVEITNLLIKAVNGAPKTESSISKKEPQIAPIAKADKAPSPKTKKKKSTSVASNPENKEKASVKTKKEAVTPTPKQSTTPSSTISSAPVSPKAIAKNEGYLKVVTIPAGAMVFLDIEAKSRGKTPLDISDIKCGKHSILLTLDGFPNTSAKVNINCGTVTEFNLEILSE